MPVMRIGTIEPKLVVPFTPEYWEREAKTELIMPTTGAMLAMPKKIIHKTITKGGLKYLLAGGIAGAGAMALLGGGGQEQKAAISPTAAQPIDQESRVQQALRDIKQQISSRLELAAQARAEARAKAITTTTTEYRDITAGRDVTIGGQFILPKAEAIPETQLIQVPTQETFAAGQVAQPLQYAQPTAVQPSVIEQVAQRTDLGLIALLAVGAIVLFTFLKGGKKK